MRHRVPAFALAALVLPLALSGADADTAAEEALGERLAELLRAARSVVSAHQELINDPSIGEKDLGGDRVVDEAVKRYVEQRGEPPVHGGLSPAERELAEAQIAAIREVVDEHQDQIDAEGVGFKGFIPAVFGRLVNERFAEKVGEQARIKVTAPAHLVRNRKARADDWGREVLESRFLASDWPRGQAYTESVEVEGRPAFRMLLPEYYSASCLTCHGQPKGEVDVTGYPKEGGAEGDLAGAISITLFRLRAADDDRRCGPRAAPAARAEQHSAPHRVAVGAAARRPARQRHLHDARPDRHPAPRRGGERALPPARAGRRGAASLRADALLADRPVGEPAHPLGEAGRRGAGGAGGGPAGGGSVRSRGRARDPRGSGHLSRARFRRPTPTRTTIA